MAMSRKHYREVAEILATEVNQPGISPETEATVRRIASELASFFKRDNGAFQREKFLQAAGVAK